MSEPLLPPEVLYLIFCQLPAQHLKTALLVCCRWRQVAEAPGLWKNVNLRVTRENIGLMPDVLGARRMLDVSEITVGDVEKVEYEEKVANVKKGEDVEKMEDVEKVEKVEKVGNVKNMEELLLAISCHRGITRLNLTSTDLSTVDTGLLARVLTGVYRLEVEAAKMTTRQIEAFLETLGGQTKLKLLTFSKIDLTAVDPALLARAVNCLEGVGFVPASAKLTNVQSEAILTRMANHDTRLKYFGGPHHTVPLDVLVRAINKLEKIFGNMTGPSAEALLRQSLVETKLTRAIITTTLDVDKNLVKAARKVIPHLDVSKTAVYHRSLAECPNNHPK